VLEDLSPVVSRTFSKSQSGVVGVNSPIGWHVKTRKNVVRVYDWTELGNFSGAYFSHVDTAVAVERGDAPVLFKAGMVSGEFYEAASFEASREAGLSRKNGLVEVPAPSELLVSLAGG